MNFYHDLITQKSWQALQELNKELEFLLIGGWAVWLYTSNLKSKDIDLIVDFNQLEEIRKKYNLNKNERLKKYEARVEEVSIDIYIPYYSDLGIPVEEIQNWRQNLEGFQVPEKEVLLILKQKAWHGRKFSVKGRKDLIDIISLILLSDFNFKQYKKHLKKYKLESYIKDLIKTIKETKEVKELDLNRHKWSKEKKDLLKKL